MNVKNEEERKSTSIGFRVDYRDRFEIETEAERLGISISDFIRKAVEHFVNDLRSAKVKTGGESWESSLVLK